MTIQNNFKKAITMKGFSYLKYYGGNIDELEELCKPYEVRKTKRFNSTKKVSIDFPNGNSSIEPNNILLKISDVTFLVLTTEEFDTIFFDA